MYGDATPTHGDEALQVDKEASGPNVELILGEDDMAAVEEPVAVDDEEGAEPAGQQELQQQLDAIKQELAQLRGMLLKNAGTRQID